MNYRESHSALKKKNTLWKIQRHITYPSLIWLNPSRKKLPYGKINKLLGLLYKMKTNELKHLFSQLQIINVLK